MTFFIKNTPPTLNPSSDSVLLGNIHIPINCLQKTISNSTHRLTLWNNDKDYPISFRGSCICINYKDRYFLLSTRHQLKHLPENFHMNVGIIIRNGEVFCSSSKATLYPENMNESEIYELCIFDFTEHCNNNTELINHFIKHSSNIISHQHDQNDIFLAFGYPYDRQEIEYESTEMHFVNKAVCCHIAPPEDQSSDTSLMRLKPIEELNFNPDGLSGGAVYVTTSENNQFHTYLAGMILRAGKNDIYALKLNVIINSIERHIARSY